jgi:hypothetical protein
MDIYYKYRTYSPRALEMLTKREVYFASPDQLNDPYDCRISIRRALEEAITNAVRNGNGKLQSKLERFRKIAHVYEKMEEDLGKVGVLSLSRTPTNVVMWAHYAENHQGFCAGFHLSEKFTTHRNSEGIVGITDVAYPIASPFVEFFEEIAQLERPPAWEEFWQTLLSTGMVAKAEPWAYEKEVRVLRKGPGPVSFEPSELVEIVFGMNMSAGNRDAVRQLAHGKEWNHVRFREIARSEGFEIGIQDAAI